MSVSAETVWLLGYFVFEFMVWSGAWYFFTRVIKRGPDMDSPVVGSAEDAAAHAGGGVAKPAFAKPMMDKR